MYVEMNGVFFLGVFDPFLTLGGPPACAGVAGNGRGASVEHFVFTVLKIHALRTR